MPNYTGKKNINSAALGDFEGMGFSLHEPDDHFVELYFKDKLVATYIQVTLSIILLRDACSMYLKSITGEWTND